MKRALLATLALAAACAPENWGPDQLAHGAGTLANAQLQRGRRGYQTYCIGCHGGQGDAAGPAAKFFATKPRDFRLGRLKFTAAPAGSPPADSDYLGTIRHGLAGTAMPAFPFIPETELVDIVAYVKSFYPGWKDDAPVAPVPIPDDPFHDQPESAGIAVGETTYHGLASCYGCHSAYVTYGKILEARKAANLGEEDAFRPDLYKPIPKDSDWGAPIAPPDFLFDRLKRATTRDDLVRVIASGVGGTAMPSWGSAGLTAEQLWGLAYYVESLVRIRATPQAEALHAALLAQGPPPAPPAPAPTPP